MDTKEAVADIQLYKVKEKQDQEWEFVVYKKQRCLQVIQPILSFGLYFVHCSLVSVE